MFSCASFLKRNIHHKWNVEEEKINEKKGEKLHPFTVAPRRQRFIELNLQRQWNVCGVGGTLAQPGSRSRMGRVCTDLPAAKC